MEERAWEFVAGAAGCAPGLGSMVGYRALDVAESVHRGLPSAWVTFIVSLDDGVRMGDGPPVPVVLAGLHMRASHVRQGTGQAGVQVAVHPLAARAVFGVPAAEPGGLGNGTGMGPEEGSEEGTWAEYGHDPDRLALPAGR